MGLAAEQRGERGAGLHSSTPVMLHCPPFVDSSSCSMPGVYVGDGATPTLLAGAARFRVQAMEVFGIETDAAGLSYV